MAQCSPAQRFGNRRDLWAGNANRPLAQLLRPLPPLARCIPARQSGNHKTCLRAMPVGRWPNRRALFCRWRAMLNRSVAAIEACLWAMQVGRWAHDCLSCRLATPIRSKSHRSIPEFTVEGGFVTCLESAASQVQPPVIASLASNSPLTGIFLLYFLRLCN